MDEPEERENSVAEEQERESLGRALGMIPSGIFVVTTARDSVRAAYVGSWIQQAAFEPPVDHDRHESAATTTQTAGAGARPRRAYLGSSSSAIVCPGLSAAFRSMKIRSSGSRGR